MNRVLAALAAAVIALALSLPARAQIVYRSGASAVAAATVAPAYVGNQVANTGAGGGTSLTISTPAGIVANDLLIAQIAVRGVTAVPAPSGWTLIDSRSTSTAGGQITQAVYWRLVAPPEPAGHTWSWTGTQLASGGMLAFRNLDTVNPIDAAGGQPTNNSKTITAPSQNQTIANAMLVGLFATATGSNIGPPSGGMTQVYEQGTGSGASGARVLGAYQLSPTTGGTGNRTATAAQAADNVGHQVLLRPLSALTIAVPAGTAANDVMIASVTYGPCSAASGGACTTTIATPSGWTLLRAVDTTTGGGPGGAGGRLLIYQRLATAGEPASYTWYFAGAPSQTGAVGSILSFSGVDTANPIAAEAGQATASGSAHTAPDIDTGTVTNTMLVSSHAVNSSGSWTEPGGMTERVDRASLALGNNAGVSLEVNTEPRAAAGATGSRTATLSSPPAADTGAAHLLALRPAVALDHIRIEHDNSALTCMAETLTIKACANASCSLLATSVTVAGNLTWAGAPGGTLPFTITAPGTGQTTVSLAVTTAQTVTLGVNSVAPAPLAAADCNNGTSINNTTACQLPFADAGFIFSTAADGLEAVVGAQTAGVAFGPYWLRAVKTGTTTKACEAALSGPQTVKFNYQCIDPATCSSGSRMTIGSTTVGSAPTDVSISFDANGNASLGSITYVDVGRIYVVATKALGSVTLTGTLKGSGGSGFVVKPYDFQLAGIKCTTIDAANCGAGALAMPTPGDNPAAADASGLTFIRAGDAFSVTVTALAFGGAATPNYGKEGTPETVKLTSALVGGLGLTDNPAPAGTFSAFADGSATGTAFSWDEVGIITLTPSVGDGSYLDEGDVTGTTSPNIGRFYPHHFTLPAADTLTNRSDQAGCAASTFTYLDEPLQLNFNLQAENRGNTATRNYAGAFAKFALATPANFNFGARTATTVLTPRLSAGSSAGSWSNGVATVSSSLTIGRLGAAPWVDGPFLGTQFGIAPTDTDGVALASFDTDMDAVAGNERGLLRAVGASPLTTDLYFGEMRLIPAYGSELMTLAMTAQVLYWNGTAFIPNTADSCTSMPAAAVSLGNWRKNLAVGETAVSPATITFAGGAASMRFAAPGTGNNGSVDATVDLAGSGLGYLRGPWGGAAGYNANPSAPVVFGAFKGTGQSNRSVIYQRENF